MALIPPSPHRNYIITLQFFFITGEQNDRSCQALHHLRHACVVDSLRRVLRRVVVGVAVERGVRDHHGPVAFAPEGELIAPRDTRRETPMRAEMLPPYT